MTKLDFEGTRAELTEHVVVADFTDIRQGGRRRKTRRQVFGGMAALVAVAAGIGVGVPVLTSEKEMLPAGAVQGPLGAEEWLMKGPSTVIHQASIDDQRGYVMLDADGRPDGLGKVALAHTTDGGRSWESWLYPVTGKEAEVTPTCPPKKPYSHVGCLKTVGPLPVHPDGFNSDLADVLVLDPLTVLKGNFITRDAGRSWAKVPRRLGPAVDSVPAEWRLAVRDDSKVIAFDPATGVQHPLANQPAMRAHPDVIGNPIVKPAEDGSLWLHGDSGDKRIPTVAVSHDQGKTWKTRTFPGAAGGDSFTVSRDGRTGYALFVNGVARKAYVARTTDGGETWGEPKLAAGLGAAVGLEIAADGALLSINIASPRSPALVSRDGGRTFSELPAVGLATSVSHTIAGAIFFTSTGVERGQELSNKVTLSNDGTNFQPLPLPPNAR